MKTNQAVCFINCVSNFSEYGFRFTAGDISSQSEKQNLLRCIIEK